jgi:hypothetical protein
MNGTIDFARTAEEVRVGKNVKLSESEYSWARSFFSGSRSGVEEGNLRGSAIERRGFEDTEEAVRRNGGQRAKS